MQAAGEHSLYILDVGWLNNIHMLCIWNHFYMNFFHMSANFKHHEKWDQPESNKNCTTSNGHKRQAHRLPCWNVQLCRNKRLLPGTKEVLVSLDNVFLNDNCEVILFSFFSLLFKNLSHLITVLYGLHFYIIEGVSLEMTGKYCKCLICHSLLSSDVQTLHVPARCPIFG